MIGKFFVVGAISTAIDFAVYALWLLMGGNYISAIVIGYSCGFIVNFVLVRGKVFTKSRFESVFYEFFAVLFVSLLGIELNIFIVGGLKQVGWDYYSARFVAICIVFFFNYYMRKGFIYVA